MFGQGRGQFSAGVVLVVKRFHRESHILVDPVLFYIPTIHMLLLL